MRSRLCYVALTTLTDLFSKKNVNLTQCRKRNLHVKWVNDNTFRQISDFWRTVWNIIIYSWELQHYLECLWYLQVPSKAFKNLWILVALSSKILALPGEKSHTFELEKVDRYTSRAESKSFLCSSCIIGSMKMNDDDYKYEDDDTWHIYKYNKNFKTTCNLYSPF